MLTGENGILKRAGEAKEKTSNAQEEEKSVLCNYEEKIDEYSQSSIIKAADISNSTDKSEYYGKMVLGYTPKNGLEIGWKIFYADAINIYIIADDYIETKYLPFGTNELGEKTDNKPTNGSMPRSAYFGNELREDYKIGTDRIKDLRIKKLNNDYFNVKNYSSIAENMKGTSYLLDTEAWNDFTDGDGNADYAIGGPTIEMVVNSYSQKYNVHYKASAVSATGYQVSIDDGTSWADNYDKMLDENDSLYVIKSQSFANVMWVASPSAAYTNSLMYVNHSGTVSYGAYSYDTLGFRPVICLKQNARLEKNENGYLIK